MNEVLYWSKNDPVYAQYLLARFPPFLQKDQSTYIAIKQNTGKWLKKTATTPQNAVITPRVIDRDLFTEAVYGLARVYTYGSKEIPANTYRANRFIRILKILGDERHQELRNEVIRRKNIKNIRNQKILTRIK